MGKQEAKQVLLGMPGYGESSMGAARGFYRCSQEQEARIPLKIARTYQTGSLLAQNFNGLWCYALNRSKRRGLDYFAMIHADVEPQDYWLDVLIEEMEEKHLDVLSCVIPIKDGKGITSTAVARDDGDNWRPKFRITMHELFMLPETFTSEDVGGPLLLNTGLWVCKFNFEWCHKVHFEINDQIVHNKETDSYFAQVEPEDWYFSRLLHELGLNIGATRKVKLAHKGSGVFTNLSPWGSDKIDENYVSECQLPPRKDGQFRYPVDVDGWLMPEEGEALFNMCRDKTVLEIGSYCGKSTICIAQSASQVVSVDTHDGRGTPKPRDTYFEFTENIERWGFEDKVFPFKGDTAGYAEIGGDDRFDRIFIDGDHSKESVQKDIEFALPRLADGGLLIFHDYRITPGEHDGRWDPGVTEAVDEFLDTGAELIERHETLAVVRPPAKELLEIEHG